MNDYEVRERLYRWWGYRIAELGPVSIPEWYMDELRVKFVRFCQDCNYPIPEHLSPYT